MKIKTFLLAVLGIILMSTASYAVDRSKTSSVSPFTGDSVSFAKVTLSSTTASALGAYSTSRGALTCVNADSTNTVYIGSSTAVSASGPSAFPLYAKQAIQFVSNGAVFGIGDATIASTVVYCITEN